MPTNTLDYTPIYSGSSVKHSINAVSTSAQFKAVDVINGLAKALGSAGWTLSATGLYATGQTAYVFGLPVVTSQSGTPSHPVSCGNPILSVNGIEFVGYNPYTDVPAAGGPCVFVAWGTSAGDSGANLAAQVTAHTDYNCVSTVPSSTPVLTYTAKFPGPTFNFEPIVPDGRWAAGNTLCDGGGYRYASGTLSATDTYYVDITGVKGGLRATIDGQVQIAPENLASYKIDTYATSSGLIQNFTYLANPTSFTLWANRDDFSNTKTSLLVLAPRYSEFTDVTNLRFAIAPGLFRNNTCLWTTCSVYANGAASTFDNGPYPKPLALRSPGPTALLTLANTPISIGTYMIMGFTSSGTEKVCAKLWDCVMVSDLITTGTTMSGKKHDTVASQNGNATSNVDTGGSTQSTRSSLLWGYDNQV